MKKLNILGCVPDLLNVLMELAYEAEGFKEFRILKNIDGTVEERFKPQKDWSTEFYECFRSEYPEDLENGLYALSVVGTDSKPIVYQYFKNELGIDEENFVSLVHTTSVLSASVSHGRALQVEPLSVISSCTEIGFAVNIKRGCSIGHHCEFGDFVTINPGVTISSNVVIGSRTMIGSGAVIRDHIKIGSNSVVGVGSVVVKDIPENCIAFGNPCKVIKRKEN